MANEDELSRYEIIEESEEKNIFCRFSCRKDFCWTKAIRICIAIQRREPN